MDFSRIILSFLVLLPAVVLGSRCPNPKVVSQVYTTTEGVLTADTVFIVDFSITCSNNAQNLNLYAEMNGQTLPISSVVGTNKYQLSMSSPHKDLPRGQYQLKLYDEEGYSELRKAMRSGEDTTNIKSIETITIDHPGATTSQWFQSKLIATFLAGFVAYFAYEQKAKLAK